MTTHFTSQFRKPIGVLAGLSLVVSVFVISPATTTAQTTDPAPSYLASFDACPPDAIPDADFSDVSSRHRNVDDIDCIAYYGITKGTSPPGTVPITYSPDAPVIREHMALFLTRLARLVGIDLPPPGSTPFTDIGHLTRESRDAISQIYQLRITIGATTTTYAPARDVSRGEMALFLSRLMDRMDPVADGRDAYGYIPADVDDNRGRFDIGSPYRDLTNVFVETFDAVTNLYELGVGSGTTSSTYGPGDDMSRAAMAEFMAGILDHSNARPAGTTVQVTPKSGLDNFDITMMISYRDSNFNPVEDQPVDWFYTGDEDGGLVRGGCDDDLILPNSADCTWDEDRDDETDRDGNIFQDRIEAVSGATNTFYAWVGRRDGDEFEEHTVEYSTALTHSAKGPRSIRVTPDDRDIPPTAFKMSGTDDSYIVDLDIDSVEFTIQLLDDLDMPLELEGIEIEVEVDTEDILLLVDREDSDNFPAPVADPLTGDDEYDETLVTDRDGEAVFELDAPRRNHRLDTVNFNPDCQDCESVTYEIYWSEGDPVLVTARPQFELYLRKPRNDTIKVPVEYGLYDQYGETISSTTDTRTGRTGTTLKGLLAHCLHGVADISIGTVAPVASCTLADDEKMLFSRGRFTASASSEIHQDNTEDEGFLMVLKPTIFSDHDTNGTQDSLDDAGDANDEVRYVEDEVVVWIVEEANRAEDKVQACALTGGLGGTYPTVAVYPDRNEFRTCFTLWRYDGTDDRFFVGNDEVGIDAFEAALVQVASQPTALQDLTISFYSSRRSGLSVFRLP
ncbi:MAG: S-layer homology domain-containing protein [bacterium]|nr:S-layer homology domain-containing protein [bacterium]